MLLKYLFLVVIFYFIVKTSGNLMRALRGELDAGYRDSRFQDYTESERRQSSSGWETPNPSRRSTYRDEDIEDAKWEDLD